MSLHHAEKQMLVNLGNVDNDTSKKILFATKYKNSKNSIFNKRNNIIF